METGFSSYTQPKPHITTNWMCKHMRIQVYSPKLDIKKICKIVK